jgi:hypothetical protein
VSVDTTAMPVTLSVDWTAEYRGLTIGSSDSPFTFTEIAGLLDAPAIRANDRTSLRRHGEQSGDDWFGARAITLTIEINAGDPAEFGAAMAAVADAFIPGRIAPFSFKFPGVAGGGPRVVWGKVRKRSVPVTWEYAHGYATVAVELYCPDPFVYATTTGTGRATLPTSSATPGAGIRFPLRFPARFGQSEVAEVIRVTNDGNTPVPMRFTLRGPIVNPRIVDLATGAQLAIAYTLLSGQWLDINTANGDVLMDGVAPRFLTPGRANTWLTAPPGVSEFGLRGTRLPGAAPEPELIAQWRAAWV